MADKTAEKRARLISLLFGCNTINIPAKPIISAQTRFMYSLSEKNIHAPRTTKNGVAKVMVVTVARELFAKAKNKVTSPSNLIIALVM